MNSTTKVSEKETPKNVKVTKFEAVENHSKAVMGEFINDDGDRVKMFRSKNYNFNFNLENGKFARWGVTKEDDPKVAPYGPEILDLEISTICHGINNKPCAHCYKSNTGVGDNMSFETFKTIFHKIPKTLTQIAFGIGDIDSNPDMWKMFDYCQTNDYNTVVPNVTINGWNLTDEYADKLANLCGAVAVSKYNPKDICYDAVKKLTDRGMEQVNIHMLLATETLDTCFEVVDDMCNDPRLEKLNAIVFLYLKPKGKRNRLTILNDVDKYRSLVDYCIEKNIRFGFDSCSAPMFLRSVKDRPNFKMFDMMAESCESSCFSSYINTEGRYFHCSFTEGEDGWEGIDVVNCNDFLADIWYGPETLKFRNSLLTQHHEISPSCRECPVFKLY